MPGGNIASFSPMCYKVCGWLLLRIQASRRTRRSLTPTLWNCFFFSQLPKTNCRLGKGPPPFGRHPLTSDMLKHPTRSSEWKHSYYLRKESYRIQTFRNTEHIVDLPTSDTLIHQILSIQPILVVFTSRFGIYRIHRIKIRGKRRRGKVGKRTRTRASNTQSLNKTTAIKKQGFLGFNSPSVYSSKVPHSILLE